MPLVDQPFAATFAFARARPAEYRNAAGALVTAAVDAPRFDHDEDGRALGVLVEGRPQFGAADRLIVADGDWNTPKGTVLHEYETLAGEIRRRAFYAPADARASVNACLNAKGRHRRVAYVPKYLPNRGGYVRWRNLFWTLGGVILAEAGVAVGVTADTPLLEG